MRNWWEPSLETDFDALLVTERPRLAIYSFIGLSLGAGALLLAAGVIGAREAIPVAERLLLAFGFAGSDWQRGFEAGVYSCVGLAWLWSIGVARHLAFKLGGGSEDAGS